MKRAFIGDGGHTNEVSLQMGVKLPRFVDDEYYIEKENLYPLSKLDINEYEVMITIGDVNVRKKIVESLPKNTKFFTFIHPSAIILDENVVIGEGSFIGLNSVLTTNIKIGKHALLNRSNHIGHDTIIGDYFSAMPSAIVSGNVIIGDQVYLGTNSSIREKIKICNNVTIGLQCGVYKDIAESGVYVDSKIKKIK